LESRPLRVDPPPLVFDMASSSDPAAQLAEILVISTTV
jgi:hypothetical protein